MKGAKLLPLQASDEPILFTPTLSFIELNYTSSNLNSTFAETNSTTSLEGENSQGTADSDTHVYTSTGVG
jgi:hypothetical protein